MYINGAYEGLYALVEAVDSAFLARELGDGLGYLFEHKFVDGFYGEFLGDDYAPYKLRFEAQTHRLESDYTLYAPIRELFREVNQDVDSVWRERVSWFVDLPQVVTHVAIETFLASSTDSWADPGWRISISTARSQPTSIACIAWDRDTTFQDLESPIFARVAENALMSRALQVRRPSDAVSGCARAVRALGGAGSLARRRRSAGRIS